MHCCVCCGCCDYFVYVVFVVPVVRVYLYSETKLKQDNTRKRGEKREHKGSTCIVWVGWVWYGIVVVSAYH
jgi:hypothetical protein